MLSVSLPFNFHTNTLEPFAIIDRQDLQAMILQASLANSFPIMQQPAGPLLVPLLAVASASLLQPFSSFSAPPPRHPVRI